MISASKAIYKHYTSTHNIFFTSTPQKNNNSTMNDSFCRGATLSFHPDEDCPELIVVKNNEGEEVEFYR
jgi:hypothetical protein